jgi:tetratricopeptide (TPR) repeat protein
VLTAKKKISVREVVPKSASAVFYYDAQKWLKANSKIVIGAFLAIAALIVIGYLYTSGKSADDLAANRELRKVQPLYQQQQYKLAIAGDPTQQIMGLEEIVDKYSGTPTGDVAMIYLGNCYLYSGDLDKAESIFDDVSPSTDMLKSAAVAGRASVAEAKGDYAGAAPLFEKAARGFDNELISGERFISAGRAYAIAGDMDSAKEMLEMVKGNKTQRFQQEADRLIAQYNLDDE